MALSECKTIIDLHDQELLKHGDYAFPIACYADDLDQLEVAWHWHDEWEFVTVSTGKPIFHVGNQHITLETGDGLFINSRKLHAVYRGDESSTLHSAVFHPRLIGGHSDSTFWQKLIDPIQNNDALSCLVFHRAIDWQNDVLDHFEIAWHTIADEADDYENTSRYLLSKMFHQILQNMDIESTTQSAKQLRLMDRTRLMMEYIDTHYMEDISVEDISSVASISKSSCLRCFHEILNTTPTQYVIDTRLRKAIGQLQTTNKSIKDIALECGFSDMSYFNKLFKKTYQCTPKTYQKIYIQD